MTTHAASTAQLTTRKDDAVNPAFRIRRPARRVLAAACLVLALPPVRLDEAAAATSDAATLITVTAQKPVDPRAFARRATRSGSEYACLLQLWTRESNWNPRSRNKRPGNARGDHAFGIAQMLGETSKDPITQVRHGLAYIAHRYGDACTALRFWQQQHPHWY